MLPKFPNTKYNTNEGKGKLFFVQGPGQPHYEVFQKDADNTFLQKKEVIPGFSIRQTTFLTILL
ncbi:MAG: hypothetical protein LBS57_03630, partial [Treponema sp.]|nr:hypothetical protein [Treponema sp.]